MQVLIVRVKSARQKLHGNLLCLTIPLKMGICHLHLYLLKAGHTHYRFMDGVATQFATVACLPLKLNAQPDAIVKTVTGVKFR